MPIFAPARPIPYELPKRGVGRAREARDRGIGGALAADATASYLLAFKLAAPAMIVVLRGAVGWVAPVAAILEAIN